LASRCGARRVDRVIPRRADAWPPQLRPTARYPSPRITPITESMLEPQTWARSQIPHELSWPAWCRRRVAEGAIDGVAPLVRGGIESRRPARLCCRALELVCWVPDIGGACAGPALLARTPVRNPAGQPGDGRPDVRVRRRARRARCRGSSRGLFGLRRNSPSVPCSGSTSGSTGLHRPRLVRRPGRGSRRRTGSRPGPCARPSPGLRRGPARRLRGHLRRRHPRPGRRWRPSARDRRGSSRGDRSRLI